ncbi:MAG: amino acid ABC transporter substrate-binding protein, partial [Verrucomicrobia bacterium]|nr:amino acid ABC transporter substrate-binding protein [Verrucomicrobiota bacterium]
MKRLLTIFILLFATAEAATAQQLVWAADAEGGAPYVLPDPQNPAKMIGFEVDFADELARRIGRKARFQQNQWDGLVPGLERGEYDVVINGLEITADRAEKINFSTPYFYSTLTLTERIDETRIIKPEDLNGKVAGTLKVSTAERYLRSLGSVKILSYD